MNTKPNSDVALLPPVSCSADVAALRQVRDFVSTVNEDCREDEERDQMLALIDGLLELHPLPPHLEAKPLASAIARGLSHDDLKREFYSPTSNEVGLSEARQPGGICGPEGKAFRPQNVQEQLTGGSDGPNPNKDAPAG